jgi:hypothetical protein
MLNHILMINGRNTATKGTCTTIDSILIFIIHGRSKSIHPNQAASFLVSGSSFGVCWNNFEQSWRYSYEVLWSPRIECHCRLSVRRSFDLGRFGSVLVNTCSIFLKLRLVRFAGTSLRQSPCEWADYFSMAFFFQKNITSLTPWIGQTGMCLRFFLHDRILLSRH